MSFLDYVIKKERPKDYFSVLSWINPDFEIFFQQFHQLENMLI